MTHHTPSDTQNILLKDKATQLYIYIVICTFQNLILKLILATMAANLIFSQNFQIFFVLTKSVLMVRSSFQLCALWRRQAVMSAVDKAEY